MSDKRSVFLKYVVPGGILASYAAIAGVACVRKELPGALPFSPASFANVGQTMAPLLAIAAFIERGVEVLIASVRGLDAVALDRKMEEQRAVLATSDPPSDGAKHAFAHSQKAVDEFRAGTQRTAFIFSFIMSAVASLLGVRALQPLLAPANAAASPPVLAPSTAFVVFDVVLTAIVLTGGSDGIHQVVTAVTGFMEASKASSKRNAAG